MHVLSTALKAQTSANASYFDQKWSRIRSLISRLTLIRIRTYAGLFPKCCGFFNISRFAECRKNKPMTVWEMLINILKSPIPQWWGKWKSDPESVSRIGSPVLPIGSPNHNTNFQWNRLNLVRITVYPTNVNEIWLVHRAYMHCGVCRLCHNDPATYYWTPSYTGWRYRWSTTGWHWALVSWPAADTSISSSVDSSRCHRTLSSSSCFRSELILCFRCRWIQISRTKRGGTNWRVLVALFPLKLPKVTNIWTLKLLWLQTAQFYRSIFIIWGITTTRWPKSDVSVLKSPHWLVRLLAWHVQNKLVNK